MEMPVNRKVWIFSHYSADPRYNSGLRYFNWAKELLSRGYSVTVFCASTIHAAKKTTNLISDCRDFIIEEYEGVQYIYVKCSDYQGNGMKRIMNMFEFAHNLKKVYKRFDKPDFIIGRLPHVWCGEVAWKASKHFKVPLICDVADLWPEGFVEHLHIGRNNPAIIYYNALEHRMYKRADALVFSMAGGKQLIRDKGWKDIEDKKIFHINMGVDLRKFDSDAKNYRKEYPEIFDPTLFKVSYCGSIRLINYVSTLCEAAKILAEKGIDNVFFSIHGYGDKEDECKTYCEKHGLKNIKFFGRINKEQIPFVLTHSDVNVLSYHETPLYKYGGSMSKMFEAFASGKPVLSNVHMGYSLIDEYGCGLVSESNTPQAIAKAIIQMMNMDPSERDNMGKAGRRCAEDYDQPHLVDQLEEVFKYVLEGRR